MKRIAGFLCAALTFAGAASAQPVQPSQHHIPGPSPVRSHFAPESEAETNSMSFLLQHGYQVVAAWDGTLVLQHASRVYLCPFIRVREGNTEYGRAISQPCQHIREGMVP